jgi:hypothetical protein
MSEWHRPLSALLTDVFDAVVAVRSDYASVGARSIELHLPLEVSLRENGKAEPTFIGDVPVWRWRTPFDQEPGRLSITWQAGER